MQGGILLSFGLVFYASSMVVSHDGGTRFSLVIFHDEFEFELRIAPHDVQTAGGTQGEANYQVSPIVLAKYMIQAVDHKLSQTKTPVQRERLYQIQKQWHQILSKVVRSAAQMSAEVLTTIPHSPEPHSSFWTEVLVLGYVCLICVVGRLYYFK